MFAQAVRKHLKSLSTAFGTISYCCMFRHIISSFFIMLCTNRHFWQLEHSTEWISSGDKRKLLAFFSFFFFLGMKYNLIKKKNPTTNYLFVNVKFLNLHDHLTLQNLKTANLAIATFNVLLNQSNEIGTGLI